MTSGDCAGGAHGPESGRVAPGDCSPGAPTDPDVRNYRIRLFEKRIHYASLRVDGRGNGKIRSSAFIQSQRGRSLERRRSHLNHIRVVRNRNASSEREFPETP